MRSIYKQALASTIDRSSSSSIQRLHNPVDMSLTTPPTLNSAMGPELDTKLEREDEKHDVQHHEHQFSEEVQRQPLEVPFSHLSIRECLRTCWKAVMFAVMVSVGNTFDSYTVFGE